MSSISFVLSERRSERVSFFFFCLIFKCFCYYRNWIFLINLFLKQCLKCCLFEEKREAFSFVAFYIPPAIVSFYLILSFSIVFILMKKWQVFEFSITQPLLKQIIYNSLIMKKHDMHKKCSLIMI